MSKSTTSRLRQRLIEQRADDFGSVDADQAETLLDGQVNSNANPSILEKLKSMDASEKEWACSALTHGVREDTEATLSAMEKADSFAALIECLCDTEPLVVCAALGLVHACTVSGNNDIQLQVSRTLVGTGVLTPLLTICGRAALLPDDTAADRPIKVQTMSRLLSVMCNLASLNETALATICSPASSQVVLAFCFAPLQHRELHTPEIMIYSVQLLSILTDVDDESTPQPARLASSNFRMLINDEAVLLLKVTMANGNNPILLRALCVNVLMNLSLEPGREAEALAMLKVVFPVVIATLDTFDAGAQLLELDQLRATTDVADRPACKKLEANAQLWKDALDAQGLILEMLANLLILGDDSNESAEFQEMEETEENAQLGAYMGRPLFASISAHLEASDIASRLLPKCLFVQRVGGVDDIEYLSLQQRAVGCLLNAVSNPDFENTTLTGVASLWREVLDHICAPGFERTQGDLPLIHDILGNAEAILVQLLRIVAQNGAHANVPVTADDIRGFIAIANSALIPDTARSSALALLGLLTGGPWIQSLEGGEAVVSEVLALFISAMEGQSLLLAAEAANAIMDGFAENTYNAISEASLVPAINKVIALLKSKIASERKKISRVELDRLDETRLNLTRFLAYKSSQ
jgi:hypothetical protein